MKIRTIILGIIVASVVISTGFVLILTNIEGKGLEDTMEQAALDVGLDGAEDSLQGVAGGILESMDHVMDGQYLMVQTWAFSPALVSAAMNSQSSNGRDLDHEASEYLEALATKTGRYPEILVTDASGYVVAASDHGLTGDHAEEEWYEAAKDASNGLFISRAELDEDTGTWLVTIASQLRDPESGAYVGQIKAVYDYGALIRSLVDLESHEGDNLRLYELKVIGADGLILATSEHIDLGEAHEETGANEDGHDDADAAVAEDEGDGDHEAAVEQGGHGDEGPSADERKTLLSPKVNNPDVSLSNLAFFQEIAGGSTAGSTSEVDEDGEPVLMGYAVSHDVNEHTILVSVKPASAALAFAGSTAHLQSELQAATNSLMWKIGIGALIIGTAVVAISFAVVRWRISTPVAKLSAAAERLSQGDVEGLEIDVSGQDELGQLGEGFQGLLEAFTMLLDEAKEKEAA